MKRILSLFALLLVSVIGFAQAPSNYTNINGRYRWIAGMFDSTFSLPKGTTPSLRTGGSTNGGALFYRTSDSTVKYWTGTQWLTLSDSTRYVPYVGAIKDVDLDTWSLNAKSLHVKGTAGNGHVGLKFQSATPNMSSNESGLYADASGNFGVKIDNAYTSIFKTSLNSANRTYTFQNKSYTVADSADVAAKIGGTLISGYLTKATGTNTIDTSRIFQYDGRIGIGITTPSKLLHVNGDAIINTLTIGFGKGSVSSNTAVGYQSLNSNTTGQNNTAVGYGTLQANTSGTQNTAIGNISLYSNTTGTNNTAIGNSALSSNLSGNSNVSIGHNSLSSNTTGFQNVAVGIQSLNANTTGESNTAIGTGALANIITGTYNAALGISSGRYITAGGYNATSTESVYLGYDTRASADGNTNEVVIGSQAIGNGSNSVTLGNSSITKTILRSNVGIGTASPDSALTVVNGAYFQRGVRMSGLPTGVGTKALRINAAGTISIADTLIDAGGTVTSVATNNGTGITGGTITTTGTLAIDTLLISTRAWRQKGIDSVASLINTNVSGTTNYVAKFTAAHTVGNSLIYDNGTNVGIGTTSPAAKLNISGTGTQQILLTSTNAGTEQTNFAIRNSAGVLILNSTNDAVSGSYAAYKITKDAGTFTINKHEWYIGGETLRMTLDASGNLGLGVTPSSWGLSGSMQFPDGGIFGFAGSNGDFVANAYYNAGFKYVKSAAATRYTQTAGQHQWFNAASGTAGNAITFTQAMTLFSTGNLAVGGTSDNGSRLNVTGAATFSSSVTANAASTINGAYPQLILNNPSAGAGIELHFKDNGTLKSKIGTLDDINSWQVYNGGAIRFTINNSGNVGIGTTSPSEKLEVNGAIKTAAPSGGTAAAWKLGSKVTALVSLVITDYIQVEIGGVVYKLALVN